jgi:hypothetical protein
MRNQGGNSSTNRVDLVCVAVCLILSGPSSARPRHLHKADSGRPTESYRVGLGVAGTPALNVAKFGKDSSPLLHPQHILCLQFTNRVHSLRKNVKYVFKQPGSR